MSNRWPRPIVLTYHEVVPGRPTSRYTVSCAQLDAHLHLMRFGIKNGAMQPRITFDDGHRSNSEYALALLEHYGVRATFFLTAGLIESRGDFMNWSQVRELLNHGHDIQAHGWSHRFLTLCNDDELQHELDFTKKYLEDKIGRPITSVSMPGGRIDSRILNAASKLGYSFVYVSDPWVHDQPYSGLEIIGRAMIRRNTGLRHIKGLIEQSTFTETSIRMAHFLRTSARLLVGESRYHRVWTAFASRSNLHSSLK